MMRELKWAAVAALLVVPPTASAQVVTELDAYWAEVARTVVEGDFEGYATLYHPDAVLVMMGSGTVPISGALEAWKQGFDDTREGRAVAGVEFRLTERLNDGSTAHETGMFRYAFESEDGDQQVALVHFEALLVKKDGKWLMVMEYQKEPATAEEWKAAG
jgi:ketosteroid isomerase-like protein